MADQNLYIAQSEVDEASQKEDPMEQEVDDEANAPIDESAPPSAFGLAAAVDKLKAHADAEYDLRDLIKENPADLLAQGYTHEQLIAIGFEYDEETQQYFRPGTIVMRQFGPFLLLAYFILASLFIY